MAKIIPWKELLVDWLSENLKQTKDKPFTLKDLAIRWNIPYKTIRNRSSLDGWNEQLNQKIQEHHVAVVSQISEEAVLDELEIRTRQTSITRTILDKALRRLEMVSPEELTKKEAIELLRLGLVEERRAAGLADRYEMATSITGSQYPGVDERLKNHRRIEILAMRVLEAMDTEQ